MLLLLPATKAVLDVAVVAAIFSFCSARDSLRSFFRSSFRACFRICDVMIAGGEIKHEARGALSRARLSAETEAKRLFCLFSFSFAVCPIFQRFHRVCAVCVVTQRSAPAVVEKMAPPSPVLRSRSSPSRASTALVGGASFVRRDLAPWVIHDYVNVCALSIASTLVVLALVAGQRFQRPLAIFLAVYTALDGVWIAGQPHIVREPAVLLGHHAATLMLLAHALADPPMMRYVASMAVVELNSLFLTMRRHLKHWSVELLFAITWIALRVVWLPCVLSVSPCMCSIVQRVLQARPWLHGAAGLALLQLVWTHDALRSGVGSKIFRSCTTGV